MRFGPCQLVQFAVFTFAVAILLAMSLVPGTAALAAPNTALRDHQTEYDKLRADDKLYESQNRQNSNPPGTATIHESRPSPDRTIRRQYRFELPMEKQQKTNPDGQVVGPDGQQKIHTRESPKHPESPATNGKYADAINAWQKAFVQIHMSPESQGRAAAAAMQSQQQGAGDATQSASLDLLDESLNIIITACPNVANEATGTPGNSEAPFKPISQAIWMVQQMYKRVYVPMAVLLLLPGALILNMKVLVNKSMNNDANDEDIATGPFTAILRSMVAIFLIPATQLIMSYSIDVGNSMTYEVAQQIQVSEVVQWAKDQYQDRQQQNQPVQGMDPQPFGQQMANMASGVVNMSLTIGLMLLLAFQLVMSCYLLLMGPIAAALYAWPGGVGKLFKPVFVNWVNAVITLSLWRFWWVLIVLVAITRVQWLKEIGEYVPNTEWEALMLACFLVMMSYVPFAPFELKPGELVDKLLEKAKEVSGDGADSGGGGGQSRGRPNPAPKTAV